MGEKFKEIEEMITKEFEQLSKTAAENPVREKTGIANGVDWLFLFSFVPHYAGN